MTVQIDVSVESASVQRVLEALDTHLEPVAIAEFLGAGVTQYLQERGKRRFEEEGDDVSGKWLPLSQATQNIRSSMGYGAEHPINKRTGELEDYIIGSPGLPTTEVGGAMLNWPGQPPGNANLKEKLQTAQQGAKATTKNRPTPARPVLGVNEADMQNVVLMLTFFLMTGRKE